MFPEQVNEFLFVRGAAEISQKLAVAVRAWTCQDSKTQSQIILRLEEVPSAIVTVDSFEIYGQRKLS
jgi:hypothetical protein